MGSIMTDEPAPSQVHAGPLAPEDQRGKVDGSRDHPPVYALDPRATARRCAPAAARLALLAALTGCAEPPETGQCPRTTQPVLTLANREDTGPLADGREVEVFPPPQGGVFTELDVALEGVPLDELEQIEITLESAGPLGMLASVSYPGSALPMWCSDDDVLMIDDLPVGLVDDAYLPDLHGEAVVIEGRAQTRSGEVSVRYDVQMRWVDY